MEILEFILFLDDSKLKIEASWLPGEETGQHLSYDIIDDNTLSIDWGWCSYEECDNNTAIIVFGDKIDVHQSNSGNSCFGGDYEGNNDYLFNNLPDLIKWFEEEIN